MVCYCDDCQAFAHALHRQDLLDQAGGSELFGTTPASVTLDQGVEQLRCLRLTPSGMLRWYWHCCDTPFANTQSMPAMPFISVHRASIAVDDADVLGPPIRMQARFATSPPPTSAESGVSLRTKASIVLFLVKAWIRGDQKPNPLFHDGRPIAEPRVLSAVERRTLPPFTQGGR
jgi:hypothetical protein